MGWEGYIVYLEKEKKWLSVWLCTAVTSRSDQWQMSSRFRCSSGRVNTAQWRGRGRGQVRPIFLVWGEVQWADVTREHPAQDQLTAGTAPMFTEQYTTSR